MVLQGLNADIQRCEKDRDSLSLDVEQQQALIGQIEKQRQQTRSRRLESLMAADALELKIKEAEESNARLQLQLNITKHQDEYDAILHSIMSNKADISKREDEELELLQQIDELQNEAASLEKQLEAEQQNLRQIQQRVVEQTADYDRDLAQLQQQSDTVEKQIAPQVLDAYRRVANARGETALAEVKNRVCKGCFTTITKQSENDLMRDTEIVHCHSCGRLLMLAHEQWPPAPAEQT